MDLRLFVTAPRGMEPLLAGELRRLGGERVTQARSGASLCGTLATAYRVCLWSRLASRVLLPLAEGPAASTDDLYATAQRVDWDDHLGVDDTLAVDFSGTSETIRDTRFGAVRVKDAIVDQLRARHGGRRPSVDARAPHVRVNAHLARGRVTVSLDLSGNSLHRRGYRVEGSQVETPLKENLAAAVLLFAAWPHEAAAGGSFLDPLCGSGTLPIEAALMAADVAPGWLRAGRPGGFGFLRWRGHDAEAWERLVEEARERREAGLRRLAAEPGQTVRGSDRDTRSLAIAHANAARAGLERAVTLAPGELAHLSAPAPGGLLATNVPYGERLGRRDDADAVCALLGARLRTAFPGWRAAVLAGSSEQAARTQLQAKRQTSLFNGPIKCTLSYYEVGAATPRVPAAARAGRAAERTSARPRPAGMLGGGAEQFANRLRKNRRHVARRARREGITCYRVYDADLPEYNLVVDVYGEWVHVQEYAAPAQIDPAKTERRLEDALAVVGAVLEVKPDRVVLKERRRQRGAAQYERRRAGEGGRLRVQEDGIAYLVDLHRYLDTGLFLDQRLTRRLVRRLAGGRRFLNLFAYTGTMTVNALAGGAPTSTSVDMSRTYLEWAQRNLDANGFHAEMATEPGGGEDAAHRLVTADCLRWIAEADAGFDLVWLDPPTFSNSKRMGRATFDVQRDHADLIRMTARRLLAPGGVLLFSANRRGFTLDYRELGGLAVKDLSRATLPFDCGRSANRHHVFRIERA